MSALCPWAVLYNSGEPRSSAHSWHSRQVPQRLLWAALEERNQEWLLAFASLLLLWSHLFGQQRGDLSRQRQETAKWVIEGPNEVHEGPFLRMGVRWGRALPGVNFALGLGWHWSWAELILPTGADCAERQGFWHWPYHLAMPRGTALVCLGCFFPFPVKCIFPLDVLAGKQDVKSLGLGGLLFRWIWISPLPLVHTHLTLGKFLHLLWVLFSHF